MLETFLEAVGEGPAGVAPRYPLAKDALRFSLEALDWARRNRRQDRLGDAAAVVDRAAEAEAGIAMAGSQVEVSPLTTVQAGFVELFWRAFPGGDDFNPGLYDRVAAQVAILAEDDQPDGVGRFRPAIFAVIKHLTRIAGADEVALLPPCRFDGRDDIVTIAHVSLPGPRPGCCRRACFCRLQARAA